MSTTHTSAMPVISDHYEKLDLPVGVVMETVSPGPWIGRRWIKTGEIRWAQLGGGENILPDEELQDLVDAGRNNVSPCPSERLAFVEEYSGWNLRVLAQSALRRERELKLVRHREKVLSERNERARRVLAGTAEVS